MLGERLNLLRKKRKLTQQYIADRLHITRSTYAQYEIDRRVPEYATLEKLANFFDVSIDYLVGRTDKQNQILDAPVRRLIDSLDLSDEEIYNTIRMEVDGMVLEKDDVVRFVAFVRAERAMRKQVPVSEQNKQ